MLSTAIHSIVEGGTAGIIVDVECHMSNGLPNIIIVGFANKAVDEARERIRSAFATTELDLPRKRIILNLAPADLPKDSTSFDLAMAAAIIITSKQGHGEKLKNTLMIGELGLDGNLRAVRGIIGKILAGRALGFNSYYIPRSNLSQAMLVPDVELIAVNSLDELAKDLSGTVPLKRLHTKKGSFNGAKATRITNDFQHIVGQARAKRAMEIAAAGNHNVLLSGPPGTGKSMLAKALPSILPDLKAEEILEVTHLHSLANRHYDQIINERPFRAPHHSASDISILGGGQYPRPGEISLSHHGILFFDELPEFSRNAIEALRQPLEDKVITVARAKDSITFPADFMLVATSNPCPCGYFGTPKPCSCLPHQIIKYQRKLSGPIIDRIDLYVDVDEVKHRNLLKNNKAEPSSEIQKRVIRARQRQQERFNNPLKTNARLSNQDIKHHAQLSPAAEEFLNQAAEKLGISARSYMRVIKVARTIADLSDSPQIDTAHISEAIRYRKPAPALV